VFLVPAARCRIARLKTAGAGWNNGTEEIPLIETKNGAAYGNAQRRISLVGKFSRNFSVRHSYLLLDKDRIMGRPACPEDTIFYRKNLKSGLFSSDSSVMWRSAS